MYCGSYWNGGTFSLLERLLIFVIRVTGTLEDLKSPGLSMLAGSLFGFA